MKRLTAILVMATLLVFAHRATASNYDFTFTVDPSTGTLTEPWVGNDSWVSPWLSPEVSGQPLILPVCQWAVFDVKLTNRIQLRDTWLNSNESVIVEIQGGAPTEPGSAEYKFWLTGIEDEGGLRESGGKKMATQANPLTGTLGINLGGSASAHDAHDFLANTVSFEDIHLELHNTSASGKPWVISKFKVGVDADDVKIIPEPATTALFGAGLMALIAFRGKRRREHLMRSRTR